jgi:hypothetical protein
MKVYLNTNCDDIQIYNQNGEFISSDCEIFYPFTCVAYGRVKAIVNNEDDLLKLDEDFLNCLIYYKDDRVNRWSYYECIDLEYIL